MWIQNTIKMVAFMLHDAGVKTINNALKRGPRSIATGITKLLKSRHFTAQSWHRQAAFPTRGFRFAQRPENRVTQHGERNIRRIGIARIFSGTAKNNDTQINADLRCSDTRAARGFHRVHEISNQRMYCVRIKH